MVSNSAATQGVLLFCLLCSATAHSAFGTAQSPGVVPSGDGGAGGLDEFFGWIDSFPEVGLKDGLGQGSIIITTKSVLAQRYFSQGLAGIHNFWDFETQRAFRMAARHDPDCAMVWWGVMQSISRDGGFQKAASEAYAKAVSLQEKASERERMWIKASAPNEDYAERMRELVAKYPDEVDAKLMLAVFLVFSTGDYRGHTEPGRAEALRLVAEVSQHSGGQYAGAAHFAVHAYEDTEHPKDGLPQSRRLPELSPKSNHNVHMPGHVFYITGDYPTAATYFSRSMQIDEEYMANEGITPVNNWDYAHNMAYLAVTHAEAGRLGTAMNLVEKIYSQATDFNVVGFPAPPIGVSPAKRFYSSIYLYHALTVGPNIPARVGNFGMAAENLRSIRGLGMDKHADVDVNRVLKYFRGLEEFMEGMKELGFASEILDETPGAACLPLSSGEARECVKAASDRLGNLQQILVDIKADVAKVPSEDDRLGQRLVALEVAVSELAGGIQAAQGQYVESAKTLADAQLRARQLSYDEMSYYPRLPCVTTAEILAARGRRAGDNKVTRQALFYAANDAFDAHDEFYTNSGFTVFGRARLYEFMGMPTVAAPLYADLVHRWADADGDLPHLDIARKYIAAHATSYYTPSFESVSALKMSAASAAPGGMGWIQVVAVGTVVGTVVVNVMGFAAVKFLRRGRGPEGTESLLSTKSEDV